MPLKSGQTRKGLRNLSTGVSAIPDSEANQKLVHRWYLSETSSPFVDQIGSADGGSTGAVRVTGGWTDGAARQGDGTDDHILTSAWGSFGSAIDGDWAIAFSVGSNTSIGAILGVRNSADDTLMVLSTNAVGSSQPPDNVLSATVRDDGGSTSNAYGSSDLTTGGPYRVVINVPDGTDVSTWEIYVNQTDDDASVGDDGGDNFTDFDTDVSLFAWNDGGAISAPIGAIVDDVCVFGSSLTTAEAQSYSNPWS